MNSSTYIPRLLTDKLRQSAAHYPVCTVIGPRQSGKTTLARTVFPEKPYVSLEAPDVRNFALDDPRGFLGQFPEGAILDEFQRAPDLLSYIQTEVDELSQMGRYILTGSQHFLMMRDVSQSLAGRTSIHTLLPLSVEELQHHDFTFPETDDLLLKGGYPRVHAQGQPAFGLYRNYFATYVERDVRNLLNVKDLHLFETFVRLCAGRVGQLLNLHSLADDTGIAASTAREWLSLLETSFLVTRLPPYHANLGKRLVKTPKLYFIDTGLAAHLLGIEEVSQLRHHPLRGNLFENAVVSELMKFRYNRDRQHRLYFYRDSNGREVDVLYPLGPNCLPVEIKSGKTIASKALHGLKHFSSIRTDQGPPGLLVYGGNEFQQRTLGTVCGLKDLPEAVRNAEQT